MSDNNSDSTAAAVSSEIQPEQKIQGALDPGSAGRLIEWPSNWVGVSSNQSLAERQSQLDKARESNEG